MTEAPGNHDSIHTAEQGVSSLLFNLLCTDPVQVQGGIPI